MDSAERTALTFVAVGHVTHDRRGETFVAGGSAWYAAQVCRGLGHRPRLLANVGADFTQDAALAGLDLHVARAGRTTEFTNVYAPGAPRRQYVSAQAPPVLADALPPAWAAPDVLFLAPVIGEVDAAAWLTVPAGLVGVGLQGWLKRPGPATPHGRLVEHDPDTLDPARFRGAAAAFLSIEDVAGDEGWAVALAAHVPRVYLTRGAAGCDVLTSAGRAHVGVFPTAEVDATGAGDTFATAVLCALAGGAAAVDAARFGAAAASIIVEGVGAETAGRLHEVLGRYARV